MTDVRDTARWKALAKAVIARDGECAICGSTEDLQADHIIPVSIDRTLAFDVENIQVLCGYHNRQKSNKVGPVGDWINPNWLTWERAS